MQFTAAQIFDLDNVRAFPIVREFGFGNVAMGTLAVCTIFRPAWLVPAAIVGGLYYGLAGLGHLLHEERNVNETVAMVSDGFAFPFWSSWLSMAGDRPAGIFTCYARDMLFRVRKAILVRDGSGQIHSLYPGDHWRRIKQGSVWMHDFLVGDDGFGYENPGPGQFAQPSPLQEIVAPAWQLQLVSRAWNAGEIDRRIAEAQRLYGIPWEPGENCQDYLSRIRTGKSGSFQRDGLVGFGLVVAGLFVAGSLMAGSGR